MLSSSCCRLLLKILVLNIMFLNYIKETMESKFFTFFSNPEIVALIFGFNFGAAKASCKALTIASRDVHTALMVLSLPSALS